MESTVLVENNHPGSHSKLVSKVESSIRIDSITIDLDNVDEKIEAEKCSHFSMRGYVSEIRKRDWKMCWPFVSDGDSNNYEEQACLLPPLHVPKFRFWRTANCYGTALHSCGTELKSTNVCSHGPNYDDDAMLPSDVQEATNQEIPEGRQADVFAGLNSTSICHHSLSIDKNEKKTKDMNRSIIGKHMGSEDILKQENHRLACVVTEVVSSPIQKADHTDEKVNLLTFKSKGIDLCESGCEHHEVADAEFSKNLNCMVNSATGLCEAGKETSTDDQHKELIACGITANKNPVCRSSLELDEYDDPSSESAEIMAGHNSQDVLHENSSSLHRRKTRKVRLLTELLCENGDRDTDNRTQHSLPLAFPDASAGVDKISVLQGEVAIQGKVRRGLGHNRKRKLPQDEDSRSLEMRLPIKFAKKRKTERDQVSMNVFPQTCPRKCANEIEEKNGDNSRPSAVDGVLAKSAHNAFIGREMDLFPFPDPRMEKNISSPTPWNHDILREGPVIRKDAGAINTGPVVFPFHSEQETSLEKKGLDLSLNSYKTAQSYDGKHIPQVENRQSGLFTWQERTSQIQAMRKAAEFEHFAKRLHSDPNTKRPDFEIPFRREKQKYTSQVKLGDFFHTKGNEGNIGIPEHSAFPRKDNNQRADKVYEQGALDDIPMEIVELMAKNQYERCLPDGEYEKCQLETTIYGLGGLNLFHQETTQKQNPPARRNDIIKIGEMAGPTKQKEVDFFSQADRNPFSMRQLEKTRFPVGFGAFLQLQEKPSSRVQYSASSYNIQNIPQICKQRVKFQTPGPCNTCQSIPQQNKEANQLWSSMMPNHMPYIYSIPPKCVTPSTNVDVFPHSPGSFPNKNTANLGKQNRNLSSEMLSRAHAEYPFAGKHNGIELNQKPMGSLELYSNETIPAMHLLSLMDAGVQSSAPINMDVNPKFLRDLPLFTMLNQRSFLGDTGAFKAITTVKHPPRSHNGKNQLAESSRDLIPIMQTTAGASSLSIQHDKCIRKPVIFPVKLFNIKRREKALIHAHRIKQIGHRNQHMVVLAQLSFNVFIAIPCIGKPKQIQVKSRDNNSTVHPHKSSSETEVCSVNRNPADFTIPEAGNMYMIAGEALKFEKDVPFANGSHSLKVDGRKRQRRLPATKDHRRPPMS
ncbi:protein EMBRYONIC FLOWER [Salix suchowensis]|nr:protein EMBRYONIC FLOWER [Salix suchowensis]